MDDTDWFLTKLSILRDDYIRRDKQNLEALLAAYDRADKAKEKHDILVRDLLRALDRSREIIIGIGEASGNEELLKDAKVYASAIGDLVIDVASPKPKMYAESPFTKANKERVKRDLMEGE